MLSLSLVRVMAAKMALCPGQDQEGTVADPDHSSICCVRGMDYE